jgi:hypothetical protein
VKLLTRRLFGYYDDLPPKERERAQVRYLQWWRDEGQYSLADRHGGLGDGVGALTAAASSAPSRR